MRWGTVFNETVDQKLCERIKDRLLKDWLQIRTD